MIRPWRRTRLPKRFPYRKEDGKICIDVKVKSLSQIFDERDPAPFRERDLDDDLVDYVVSSSRDLGGLPLKLVVFFNKEASPLYQEGHSLDWITIAIHNYFLFESEIKRRRLRQTLRTGYIALIIGLTFLFSTVSINIAFGKSGAGVLPPIVEEGFELLGWVAMWHPINVFLYDWWPILREGRAFQRLGEIEVEYRGT